MRIIDTGITKEILSGDNHPQLKIVDKVFLKAYFKLPH